MNSPINHYKVLGLDHSCTGQQIRDRYKQLARQLHPDKNLDNNNTNTTSRSNDQTSFEDIERAYRVLSDTRLRTELDAQLQSSRKQDVIINEQLLLTDFQLDVDSQCLYHECRCGGAYWIEPESQFDPFNWSSTSSRLIQCDSCSLSILAVGSSTLSDNQTDQSSKSH